MFMRTSSSVCIETIADVTCGCDTTNPMASAASEGALPGHEAAQLVDALDVLATVPCGEELAPEVVGGELGGLLDESREAALVQHAPRDQRHAVPGRLGRAVERAGIEDVDDRLHAVDRAGGDELEREIVLVVRKRHADLGDLPAALELAELVQPVAVDAPGGPVQVELQQVDLLETERAQRLLEAARDAAAGEMTSTGSGRPQPSRGPWVRTFVATSGGSPVHSCSACPIRASDSP